MTITWLILLGVLFVSSLLIHYCVGLVSERFIALAYGSGILMFLGATSWLAVIFIRPQGGGAELGFVFLAIFLSWCGGALIYRMMKLSQKNRVEKR